MQIKHTMRLAVHLHIYYTDMWKDIKTYLENMKDYPYHLYVTLTKDNDEIIQEIKKFHKNTTIYIVENRGYDVGGFVYFLNKIDLEQYDLIIKLHTKNRNGCETLINHRYISRNDWYHLLFEGILGSNALFKKNIAKFEANNDLGMIGSKYLITSNIKNCREVKAGVQELMVKFGYSKPQTITFVAGTMFIVRNHLLKQIKDSFSIGDFEISNPNIKDGTLAHILERVFGCIVIAQGYRLNGYDKNSSIGCSSLLRTASNFVYRKKITKNNYLLIKIFKLPVYHRKLI